MRRFLLVPIAVALTCLSLGAVAAPATTTTPAAKEVSSKAPAGKSKAVVTPTKAATPATPAKAAIPATPAKPAIAASSSKPVVAATTPAKKASSTRCRDASGKFVSCATAKPKAKQCRDAHGKFTACAK